MLDKFDEQCQKAIVTAESICFDKGHERVDTCHLLLALLQMDVLLTKEIKKYGVDYTYFAKRVEHFFPEKEAQPFYLEYGDVFKMILNNALENKKKAKVNIDELCVALLESESVSVEILKEEGVEIDEVVDKLREKESSLKAIKGCESFTEIIKPAKTKTILGRDKEVKQMIIGLSCKDKANIALLGKAGVGKSAIVEELARLIRYNPPQKLKGYQIVNLDVTATVAGTKYRGEFEEKIQRFLKAVKGKKLIVFIDEAHSLTQAGSSEGSTSLSEILKPILTQGKHKFIIATTEEEYDRYLAVNKALARRFRRIHIHEPKPSQIPAMIKKKVQGYIKYHHVSIELEDIEKVISMAKTIPDRYFPDKALDIIDYTMAWCACEDMERFNLEVASDYVTSLLGKDNKNEEYMANIA